MDNTTRQVVCKLCNKDKGFVKSHIIPRSFYEVKTFNKGPALLSNSPEFNPIKRRIGIYDEKMLCAECEKKFEKCDDYAYKKLILNKDNARTLVDELGNECALLYDEYNYNLLKDFVLSLLLRAELTTDFFFQHIKLGPFGNKLKSYFNDGSYQLKKTDFSTYFFYYKEIKSGPLIAPPSKMIIKHVKFYHFHLGRLGFCIKVDNKNAPEFMSKLLITPNKPLLIIRQKFTGTDLHKLTLEFLDNPRNEQFFLP